MCFHYYTEYVSLNTCRYFQVHPSYAISLLQSDIKAALKSAFGTYDGPLSVNDWCKGRSGQFGDAGGIMMGDGYSAESSAASVAECRDSSSTVTLSVGEPISPSQSSAGGSSSCLNKGINFNCILSEILYNLQHTKN